MSYGKERTIAVEEHKDFVVGSKVIFSGFSLANYGGLADMKDKVGEVLEIKKRTVSAEDLKRDREVYRMYTDFYGILPSYDIVGLSVKFPENEYIYIVSPFGVSIKE